MGVKVVDIEDITEAWLWAGYRHPLAKWGEWAPLWEHEFRVDVLPNRDTGIEPFKLVDSEELGEACIVRWLASPAVPHLACPICYTWRPSPGWMK